MWVNYKHSKKGQSTSPPLAESEVTGMDIVCVREIKTCIYDDQEKTVALPSWNGSIRYPPTLCFHPLLLPGKMTKRAQN